MPGLGEMQLSEGHTQQTSWASGIPLISRRRISSVNQISAQADVLNVQASSAQRRVESSTLVYHIAMHPRFWPVIDPEAGK